ncbi:MAG: hypothetical protein OXM01_05855 [Gemmatimonadota bacterium]|nr:hypothetical protein [Gemmatimonadota bacterium]
MAKIAYSSRSMHGSSRLLLDKMIQITEDYMQKGYRLTVRQLYYQLVSRNIVPNSMSSYQRTSKVLLAGRMTGLVDWDIIVDRARVPRMRPQYDTISSFVGAVADSYRCFRWDDQDHYLEVMVEKEALAGILQPVTDRYHVLLLANKGYSSASAMHDVAGRMDGPARQGKQCRILYMGDHDPSGMDMVRDIRARLGEFGCFAGVERIALTMDQIEEHDLPPNPAKRSDPRSRRYTDEYGGRSWELDALSPEALARTLESRILEYLDESRYQEAIRREQAERDELKRAVAGMETS